MILMYTLERSNEAADAIRKLCTKNKTLGVALDKKIAQILERPQRFKPLRAPLQNQRRVHILKSFVLTYEISENSKTVRLIKFAHHDSAYG